MNQWLKTNVVGLVAIVLVGCLFFYLKHANSSLPDVHYENARQDFNRNVIQPKVGTIQFVDRGFSIELEKADYTADGLRLEGYIGNPTLLTISSLTLEFKAWEPPYKWPKKDQSVFAFWMDEHVIGKSQVSVSTLRPGGRVRFATAIPAVKQQKDEPVISVGFTGERYNY